MSSRLQGVLDASVATSTRRQYDSAWASFSKWCLQAGQSALPATAFTISEYLASLSTKGAASTAVAAIGFRHDLSGLRSETSSPMVHRTIQGLKKLFNKPPVQKTPVDQVMLKAMIDMLDQGASLVQWRTIWRMAIGYFTFARFSELIQLRVCDLQPKDGDLRLSFGKSKTLPNGYQSLIKQTGTKYCPVALTERYIYKLGYNRLPSESTDLLQPRFYGKGSGLGIHKTLAISYGNASKDFKALLDCLGYDASKYGEHSSRRGGACASREAGASMELVQARGQWKSSSVAEHYTKRDIDDSKISEFLAF